MPGSDMSSRTWGAGWRPARSSEDATCLLGCSSPCTALQPGSKHTAVGGGRAAQRRARKLTAGAAADRALCLT